MINDTEKKISGQKENKTKGRKKIQNKKEIAGKIERVDNK